MKIRSLNNASTLIETEDVTILIDPWLVGDLYKGAWSPYAKITDLSFLKAVSVVFISHIHEDHWDSHTLELIDRSARVLLPKMKVNSVIESRLKLMGFENIQFLNFGKKYEVSNSVDVLVIPPLNSFGQEIGSYHGGYESDATCIDTGLLLSDKATSSSHLFLCDNTPYDLKLLSENIDCKLTTLWYPFNSYAQDYPICYGLTEAEKICIHNDMHTKRIEVTKACVMELKPSYYLPHSADFVLNGAMRLAFSEYTREEFMDRERVASTYDFSDDAACNSVPTCAVAGDEITVISSSKIDIHRNKYPWEKVISSDNLEPLTSEVTDELWGNALLAFGAMNERLKRFGVDISDAIEWVLILQTEAKKIAFSFRDAQVIEYDAITAEDKKLSVTLTEQQLASLLSKELHWNNAMIGCHLVFHRTPNQYCQSIYKALNFLHL